MELVASTVSFNTAGGCGGGGIANETGSSMALTNTTISSNTASWGGGIWNQDASLELFSSTVSANSAPEFGGGIGNDGGDVNFKDTLIAGNTGALEPDCFGSLNSLGHNLIGIVSSASGFGAAGDVVGDSDNPIDPLLGALADNGGPT